MKAQDHDSVAPRSRNLFRWRRVLHCRRFGYFKVSFDTGRDAVNVRVQFGDPCSLFFIIERVRAIFDLDAGWATIARTLGTDSVLASYIRCDPGLRVPGCQNASNLRRERSLNKRSISGEPMHLQAAL